MLRRCCIDSLAYDSGLDLILAPTATPPHSDGESSGPASSTSGKSPKDESAEELHQVWYGHGYLYLSEAEVLAWRPLYLCSSGRELSDSEIEELSLYERLPLIKTKLRNDYIASKLGERESLPRRRRSQPKKKKATPALRSIATRRSSRLARQTSNVSPPITAPMASLDDTINSSAVGGRSGKYSERQGDKFCLYDWTHSIFSLLIRSY